MTVAAFDPLLAISNGEVILIVVFVAIPVAGIAFAFGAGNALRQVGKGQFSVEFEQDLPCLVQQPPADAPALEVRIDRDQADVADQQAGAGGRDPQEAAQQPEVGDRPVVEAADDPRLRARTRPAPAPAEPLRVAGIGPAEQPGQRRMLVVGEVALPHQPPAQMIHGQPTSASLGSTRSASCSANSTVGSDGLE